MSEWISASTSPSASMSSTDLSCGSRVILRSGGGAKSTSSSSSATHSHRFVRHAVFVFEDAAHPVDRGDQERLDADLLADQVLRRLDALAGVDEHEAVAEAAMQEHRDRGDRPGPCRAPRCRTSRTSRRRRNGPRAGTASAAWSKSMSVRMVRSMPSGATDAVLERAHDLVVAAGERQRNSLGHWDVLGARKGEFCGATWRYLAPGAIEARTSATTSAGLR